MTAFVIVAAWLAMYVALKLGLPGVAEAIVAIGVAVLIGRTVWLALLLAREGRRVIRAARERHVRASREHR